MDSPGEILSLCRLCLVKDQVNIPIFEEQGDIRQIFLKISSCLPVTITRHDQLPKKICDACSNKLDLLYEFWNSSATAEKTLLSWLGQAGVTDAGEKISAVAQQISKPVETLVKEESETLDESQLINEANVINETNLTNESRDSFEEHSLDEDTKDEAEAPPPKRARRTAAVKAQINITPESDEDDDEDYDAGEAMTKMEDESDESESELKDDPSYSEVPGTSADDQAGPSGVGKDGVEAPVSAFNCNVCGQCFKAPGRLKSHLKCLNIQLQNYCRICNTFINVGEEVLFHEHVMECDKVFCTFCKSIVDNECLESHDCFHPIHRKKTTRSSTTKSVPIHEKRGWPPPPYICSYCNKEYGKYGYSQLVSHEVKHRKLLSRSNIIRCKKCNLVFATEKEKSSHKYRFHKRVPLGVCDVCGFATKHISRHMAVHLEERPFQCQICPKTFRANYGLKKHMLIHSNEAKYQCKICGKAFKFSYNLTVHMRIHEAVKPFECSICNKTFTTKQWRDKHAQTHY